MSTIILDCRNDACPIPLLKASQEIKKLSSGEVLQVITSYMCAVENIMEWAQKHQIKCWMEEDEEDCEMTAFLEKP